MNKLWGGQGLNKAADSFNSSISFDKRLVFEDIRGSIAHVVMLGKCGILSEKETSDILAGLEKIKGDILGDKFQIDETAEDIHTFIENELTKLLPKTGKKLHTGRSRNDQVALDMRLWCAVEVEKISALIDGFLATIGKIAEEHKDTIMCGYTHLQRAQPVTFGYHLLAYSEMFKRDKERLADCLKRIKINPLGAGALAGTTYDIDKAITTEKLGFADYAKNTMDAVSDRDFVIEFLSSLSLIMTHISRMSEEIILWSSMEFGYIKLSSEYSTGSSIMPQKKNPDIAELARGKTGRVYGHLMSLLTTMKGLPLAYNKDMQEDKEAAFDAADTVCACLELFPPMLETMTVNAEKMSEAAKKGFLAATDIADYLVEKGMPFRDAYKVVKEIVEDCTAKGKVFEDLSLADFKKFSSLIENDIFETIRLENCVKRRGMIK